MDDIKRTDKPASASLRNERPTIGYLPSNISSNTSMLIWSGVMDAAREGDVNLISFVGGSLRDSKGSASPGNVLYSLINLENLAGLVSRASLVGGDLDHDESLRFHQRYLSVPMVTMGTALEDTPCVSVEGYQGMQEAVAHLLQTHGYRRLAFARGPEASPVAEVRYQAYLDALQEYGLFDSNLVVPPNDWTNKSKGVTAVQELLDQRKLRPKVDVEVIVAANDILAFGVLAELQARGIDVPGDVAIVGFNDAAECRTTAPSLTSVAAPFYEQGKRAVEVLLAQIAGESVPKEVNLPARLVVRQSCGCLDPAVAQVAVSPAETRGQIPDPTLAARRAETLSAITQAVENSSQNVAPGWSERLVDYFVAEMKGVSPGAFLRELDKVLRQVAAVGDDVSGWQGAISALRQQALPGLGGEALVRAENLWQQARVVIGQMAQRQEAHQALQTQQRADTLREIEAALLTTFDMEGLIDALAKGLPHLDIPSAYLALYEDPRQPTEWSRLILAYNEKGRSDLGPDGLRFPSRQLLPEGMLPQGRRYSFVVEPLYSQEHQLGFALFELGPWQGTVYDTLREQISSALQGALLVQRVQERSAELARQQYILDTFMENVPDRIYFKDLAGRITKANKAHTVQLGLADPSEETGKTDFDFFSPQQAQAKYEQEQQIIRSGQPVSLEEKNMRPDGRVDWSLTTKMPLRDENGSIVGTFGISRDITDLKQAQQTLERRAHQLQVASQVSHAASSILDPDELSQQVVNLIRERFGLYYVGLFLVGQIGEQTDAAGLSQISDKGWATLRAGTGEAGRQMVARGHQLQVGSTSMVGWCIDNKQSRIALDVGEDAVRFENPLLPATRSELALPLISRGQAIGAITVQSDQAKAFSNDDVAVLQTMADQVAVAMTNARLFEQVQQRAVELTRAKDEAEKARKEAEAEKERAEAASRTLAMQMWQTIGQAQLNERMRGEQDIPTLASNVIQQLCQYLDAQVGTLYVIEDKLLRLTGTFAYRRKHLSTQFGIGEGLVGQAALEKRILLVHVPDDYITITSASLGELIPQHILVAPFVYDGQVVGALEIGTLTEFPPAHMDFLHKALESIAIAFTTAQARTRVNELLIQTQRQAEALQKQEEELRAANEELESQAESLRASETKLKANQVELEAANIELEEKAQALQEQRAVLDRQNQELRAAQQELERKAQELTLASQYKSEFLANMSHELRTPLNSLLILAGMLAKNEEGNLTPDQVESAQIIYSGGADLLNLINEILDLSKVEAGRMDFRFAPMSLTKLVSMVRSQFTHVAEEKGLDLQITLADDVPDMIVTDQQRVEQIIKNLLGNAFKFTAEGSVRLDIYRPPPDADLNKSGLDPAQAVAFSVSDTGIGMAPDQQKIVFEAFQQADGSISRHYGGTGLGLTISRELVTRLGGQIDLVSEMGKGSTFTLYLPIEMKAAHVPESKTVEATSASCQVRERTVAPPPAMIVSTPQIAVPHPPASSLPDDRNKVQAGDRVLLIIEDDQKFAKIVYNYAHRKNFKCLVAGDGETGLKLAKTFKADAIILDLNLPGLSGWEVLDALKNDPDTRHIPVHIMSVSNEDLDAYKKGAMGFLTKPINSDSLEGAFQKIEQFIARKIKALLLVEDDDNLRKSVKKLLEGSDVVIRETSLGLVALEQLAAQHFDCMILDLNLPDMSGFELLGQMNADEKLKCPVIVYTGKALTEEENRELLKYADSVIVKGVKSPERLLDETALFLHRVIADLPEEKQRTIKQLHDQEAVFTGKQILIVDDDARNAFALSKLLADKGLQVYIAASGPKALDLLNKTPNIALVLTDIMLPGMDGYEIIQRIRAHPQFGDLPILALTAKAMKGDREKCIAAGANDYLSKPVDADRLFSMLRVWLSRE